MPASKNLKANARSIKCTCESTGAVTVYKSGTAAAKALGLNQACISHAVNGTHGLAQHRYQGMIWTPLNSETAAIEGFFKGRKHSEETKFQMSLAKQNKKTPVEGVNAGGEVVLRFASRSDVARHYGVKSTSLSLGAGGTYKGLYWRYSEERLPKEPLKLTAAEKKVRASRKAQCPRLARRRSAPKVQD